MANLIKLTNINGETGTNSENMLKWKKGIRHNVDTNGITLCTNQVLHAYENIYTAIILNSIHGQYKPFRVWFAKGGIVFNDNGLKCGVKSLEIIREATKEEIPDITIKQMRELIVLFNLLCVYYKYDESNDDIVKKNDMKFLRWSRRYLLDKTDKDPSKFPKGLIRYASLYQMKILVHIPRWIEYFTNEINGMIDASVVINKYFTNNYITAVDHICKSKPPAEKDHLFCGYCLE